MKQASPKIALHAVIARSKVNGPGTRAVIFFQGCDKRCEGCFNPETHSKQAAESVSPKELIERYGKDDIEGITVSGGEPLLQVEALTELLKAARAKGLTTVVYTGYTLEEISSGTLGAAKLRSVLDHIDVLVDGAFDTDNPEPTLMARGSTNQRIHFLTERYKEEDMLMAGKAEIIIDNEGRVTKTGFSKIERLAS